MKRIIVSIMSSAAIALTGFGGLAIATTSVQATPDTKNVTLSSGNFVTVDAGHPTTGTATIVNENGQKYVELSGSFSTASGPAVYIVLHRNSSVARNINQQDYVTLAPLQNTSGAQRYRIPDNVDLNAYNSVAIWCERFNITFGYAAI
ncbi:MAG: DM13 domain-containing protein [Cyanobacteria bacterium P01_E01_bin.6]